MSNDLAVVMESVDAFNRGDREIWKRLASEDVEIVPLRAALEGSVYRGHEGLDAFFDDTEESWSEISVEFDVIEEGPKAIFAQGSIHAQGRETGVPVEMELGWAVNVRDGKVARMATYTDVAQARRAAGLGD